MESSEKLATVEIYSQELGAGVLPEVEVIALEIDKALGKTDEQGKMVLQYPVNKKLTLLFKKSGFVTSQSATITVPPEGLFGLTGGMTYQGISNLIYKVLKTAISIYRFSSLNDNDFQIISTVTAFGKTLDDAPQGVAGAKVFLVEGGKKLTSYKPYYFGEILNKTFPVPGLTETSLDGGAVLINVKAKDTKEYEIIAEKTNVRFNSQKVTCSPNWWEKYAKNENRIINLSPPNGPTELR